MESNIFEKIIDQLKGLTDQNENYRIKSIRDDVYYDYQTGCYGIKDATIGMLDYLILIVMSHRDKDKYNIKKMMRKLANELMQRASDDKLFKNEFEMFLFMHLYREMVGKTILSEGRKRIEI